MAEAKSKTVESLPAHSPSPSSSIHLTTHHYGTDSPLQTYDTYIPSIPPLTSTATFPSKPWLVYIHGGAWRDPAITSQSILPSILLLSKNPSQPFAGYASLNYRLSSYPNFDSPSPAQAVTHPMHLSDIKHALAHLQKTFPASKEYILVGHSAGATLALQSLMPYPAAWTDLCPTPIVLPLAVVGVAGIYSLPLLVQNHIEQKVYREIVEGAFGKDEAIWKEASPALCRGWAKLLQGEEGSEGQGVVLVLAYSEEDGLVEREQVQTMLDATRSESGDLDGWRVALVELEGTHDELWEKGEGVILAVRRALEALDALKGSRLDRGHTTLLGFS